MASSRLNDALLQRGLKHVPALIRAENLKFLLALAVAVFLARSAYDLFLHPLSSIPGPRLAAVSQLWKRRADWKARRAHFMLKAHEKYGPVVRIAPNELSFSDPGLLQQVYGHKGYMKSDFYAARKMYQEDHLFSTRDPVKHAARRKLAAKTFSAQNLQEFEPVLNSKVSLLLAQWARLSGPQSVNLFPWLHWLGFEAMMSLAFDYDAKILEKGEAHVTIGYLASWKRAFLYRQTFGHWLNSYGHFLPGEVGQCFRNLRAWKQFSLDVVRKARQQGVDTVYLGKMLKEPDSSTGQLLSDSQLAEEGMGLMFGGSGTTANSAVTLIYAVLRDPAVRDRLQAEVRGVEDIPETELLPYSVTTRLPYLNAVLKETFRRYPAIIGSQPRIALQDTEISGIPIPAGTEVLTTCWTMHHNNDVFPDPDAFIPERWVASDAEQKLGQAFMPFGVGPRSCIGRNLAMMELCQVAGNFFRRFDAKLDHRMTDEMFIQNDTFNAQPQGAQLHVHLTDRFRRE